MTVKDVLSFPSFSSAILLSGHKNIDNPVTSAMILEAADIKNWGKKGQVILTSYYALKDLDDEALNNFFEDVYQLGISAIVIKMDRLLRKVPENFIRHCVKISLPLIQVPKEVKYEAIMIDIFERIVEGNIVLLNHFFDVHYQLTSLSLRHPSINQFLQFLWQSIHVKSTYFNLTENKKISYGIKNPKFEYKIISKLESEERYRNYTYYETELLYPNDVIEKAVSILIPSSDNNHHYLIVHCDYTSLQPIDFMTIENVVSILQMEILKLNAIEQKKFFKNNGMINDLLNGRYNSKSKIDAALAELGISNHNLYELILIKLNFNEDTDSEIKDKILNQLQQSIKKTYKSIVYLRNNNRLVFLHNFPSESNSININDIKNTVKAIQQTYKLSDFYYLIGTSQAVEKYSIKEANRHILDIYKLYDNDSKKNIAVSYNDLGLYKLLVNMPDISNAVSYIDPRITKLKNSDNELLQTLIVFCENNLSYLETANKIFLHHKTVRYRIDKIIEHYDIDPKDSNDLLQVLFASKIYSLQGE